MRQKATLSELPDLVGQELGPTPWMAIAQERVDTFAEATDDRQWIHVDPERATKQGPFGGPIAHGYLTVSLLAPLWGQLLRVTDMGMGVNYGLNKVRFPAPVPVGSAVRARAVIGSLKPAGAGSQLTVAMTVECNAAERPACVAEVVYRLFPRKD